MGAPDSTYWLQRIENLNAIGAALSSQTNTDALLEKILSGAKVLTNADAGTLYLLKQNQQLHFNTLHNDTLNIQWGGTTGLQIDFAPVPLFLADGSPNTHSVVASSVINDQTVNIPDAYNATGYDFAGTRRMDEKTGYRSVSFLTVPMRNHENEIIGVLQLINAKDSESGAIVPFSEQDQQLAESLASQAAIALTKQMLLQDQKRLFEAFIELIAKAIDEKNPITSRHCQRVPHLATMLAEAVNAAQNGPLRDCSFTEDELYELKIASWLHDCGKITTPEHVLNKSTKLHTLFDRIELIDARFDIIRRDLELAAITMELTALQGGNPTEAAAIQDRLAIQKTQLNDDQAFIRRCNTGGEFMRANDQARIKEIAEKYRYQDATGAQHAILNDDEVSNLSIAKGTLTTDEREIINNHVTVTIKMLESLPYPRYLRRVPEIAGGHHERCNGQGYPRGLCAKDMSLQAKILVIADVFEALTAQDRPYKRGKTLTESLQILGHMKQDNHIDPELFELFISSQTYLRYAEQFLAPEQIDDVNLAQLPGYNA